MNSTRYKDERTMIIKNRATSYSAKASGGFSTVVTHFELVGDGGLMSSVEDLGLWDQVFCENKFGGEGKALIDHALVVGHYGVSFVLRASTNRPSEDAPKAKPHSALLTLTVTVLKASEENDPAAPVFFASSFGHRDSLALLSGRSGFHLIRRK